MPATFNLNHDELDLVTRALTDQNRIDDLLSERCNCDPIFVLPLLIRQPIRDLYEYGFNLLSALNIRDRMYKIIYEITSKVLH